MNSHMPVAGGDGYNEDFVNLLSPLSRLSFRCLSDFLFALLLLPSWRLARLGQPLLVLTMERRPLRQSKPQLRASRLPKPLQQ
jgi:hypothetical protein